MRLCKVPHTNFVPSCCHHGHRSHPFQERYAILRRQIEAELGVAVPSSSARCAGAVCVLSACLLDTKLHCLARTSHDTLEVWDLTTGRVAKSVSFHDADDEERCAKELRAEYGRRPGASASWCTLGTPTGFVTVFLSHPHCFSWESTLVAGGNGDAAPRSPSSSNPRLNVGESVLLALFAPLVPQTQPPTLEIPAECEQREAWYKSELARLKSKLGKQKVFLRISCCCNTSLHTPLFFSRSRASASASSPTWSCLCGGGGRPGRRTRRTTCRSAARLSRTRRWCTRTRCAGTSRTQPVC